MDDIEKLEMELLQNLFSFIRKKNKSASISAIEKKFIDSARELVKISEVSMKILKEFCDEEGIDLPKPAAPTPKPSSPSRPSGYSSYGDGCGRGASTYRSGC